MAMIRAEGSTASLRQILESSRPFTVGDPTTKAVIGQTLRIGINGGGGPEQFVHADMTSVPQIGSTAVHERIRHRKPPRALHDAPSTHVTLDGVPYSTNGLEYNGVRVPILGHQDYSERPSISYLTETRGRKSSPSESVGLRGLESGLVVVDSSRSIDQTKIHSLPKGVEQYYVKGSTKEGLNFDHPHFQAVDHYIHERLDGFVIRASERNKQLFTEHPYLIEFLTPRIEQRGARATEAELLKELSMHMVNDGTIYQDRRGIYYLPYDDIQPNDEVFNGIRFNWDTEMHVAAVLGSDIPNKFDLAKASLKNAKFLFDVLGYVPNGASRALDDTTQPPRHSRTVRMIWNNMSPDERNLPENQQFFAEIFDFIKREYWEVYNAKDPENPYSKDDPLHQQILVDGALFTRYGGIDATVYHDVSHRGNGRDKTLDTDGRPADFERIDLLTDLYNTEEDLRWWAGQTGQEQETSFWDVRMLQRAYHAVKYHFDPETNWFYHYDFVNQRRGSVAPVTGITALRMIADAETRKKVKEKFEETFVHPFGIGLTDSATLPTPPTQEKLAAFEPNPGRQQTIKEIYKPGQWDGDNEFFITVKHVVDELLAANEQKLATRVMENAMIGLVRYFVSRQVVDGQGELPEKLNSRTGVMGTNALYGDQKVLVMPMGAFELFKKLLPQEYKRRSEPEVTLFVPGRRSTRRAVAEIQEVEELVAA